MMFEWYSILANTRYPARVQALAKVSAERLMPLPCGPPISQLRSCPLIVPSHLSSYSPYCLYVSHTRDNGPIGGASRRRPLQYSGLRVAIASARRDGAREQPWRIRRAGAIAACAGLPIVHNGTTPRRRDSAGGCPVAGCQPGSARREQHNGGGQGDA